VGTDERPLAARDAIKLREVPKASYHHLAAATRAMEPQGNLVKPCPTRQGGMVKA